MNAPNAGLHTRNEILSQPEVWRSTLLRLLELDVSSYPSPADYDQVIFSGCGSTHYLARFAAPLAESVSGKVCRAVPASDLLLFPDAYWHQGMNTLLVAISRSGSTTETVRALERFTSARLGNTLVITCYPERRLAQLSEHVIELPEAQEESVAQTRSFTSMALAVIWSIVRTIAGDLPDALRAAGQRLMDRYGGLAQQIGNDDSIQRFFFLGSGPLYGLASEAMLKMKEMSLSYSESFHFHEFRHGPMSVVDDQSLVIGCISESAKTAESALLAEMKAFGARTLTLGEHADTQVSPAPDHALAFESGIPDAWRAPLYLPLLQLMAFERSLHRGLDPDRPAHLSAVVELDEHDL
jgi:glucosamine--fructose-6-phosphate aminotransferase (isomerizing)